jgi:hypothetical protein
MPINSRNKGAQGEREIAKIWFDLTGVKLERNLDQWRAGGYDLEGLDGWAIEVKRAKKPLLNQWWQQTIEQAGTAGLKPVLWYRLDNQKWRVVLPLAEIHPDFGTSLGLEYTAELSPEGFALVWRELRLPDTQ